MTSKISPSLSGASSLEDSKAAVVIVEIIRAHDLITEDIKDIIERAPRCCGGGKATLPFALCRIGAKSSTWEEKGELNEVFEWKTVAGDDSDNPRWNSTFFIDISAFLNTNNLKNEELELQIQVWDNRGIDTLIGNAFIDLNANAMKIYHPLFSSGIVGTVCVKISSTSESVISQQSGVQVNGFRVLGTKHGVIGSIMKTIVSAVCCKFVPVDKLSVELSELQLPLTKDDMHNSPQYWYDLLRQNDREEQRAILEEVYDGQTSRFFGSRLLITHKDVAKHLEQYCELMAHKKIYRKNDVGLFRFCDTFWTEHHPPYMTLNCKVEDHRILRKNFQVLFESHCWNSSDIKNHAYDFLKKLWSSGRALNLQPINNDMNCWVTMYFNSMFLNIEQSYDQARNESKYYSHMKNMSLFDIAPPPLRARFEVTTDYENTINFINDKKARMRRILQQKFLAADAHEISLTVSAVLDTMVFAGGASVPKLLSGVLAALYSRHSDVPFSEEQRQRIKRERGHSLLIMIYELLRSYPLVVGIPFYETGMQEQREERQLLCIATALQDFRVWGRDAQEFRMRDMSAYTDERIFFPFAENCVHPSDAAAGLLGEKARHPDSRSCPGKSMALAMVVGFTEAMLDLEVEGQFFVDVPPVLQRKGDFYCTDGRFSPAWPLGQAMLSVRDAWNAVNFSGKNLLLHMREEQRIELLQRVRVPGNNLFNKVDPVTRFFVTLYKKKCDFFRGDSHRAAEYVSMPKAQCQLTFQSPVGIPSIKVPVVCEDDPPKTIIDELKGHIKASGIRFVGDILSMADNDPIYFESPQEGIACFYDTFLKDEKYSVDKCYSEEVFDDLESDNAMVQIAFLGLGQVHLKFLRIEFGRMIFEVDTTSLATYEVRPSMSSYGARAIFSCDAKEVPPVPQIDSIYVSYLKSTIKPSDAHWERAKWVWKQSLAVFITVGDHLAKTHLVVSNIASVAARTTLPANHIIRRLLKIFLAYGDTVNSLSCAILLPEYQLLHRASSFTFSSLTAALKDLYDSFKFQPFPEYLQEKNIPVSVQNLMPIFTDAPLTWSALHNYFSKCINAAYKTEYDVQTDNDVVTFWNAVNSRVGTGEGTSYGLPSTVSRSSLISYLTHVAFNGTAWHELVGTIEQYCTTPQGLLLKLRDNDRVEADVQAYLQTLVMMAMTTVPRQPKLLESWAHLLQDDDAQRDAHSQLHAELLAISAQIDNANKALSAARPRLCNIFNPKMFETSVSV